MGEPAPRRNAGLALEARGLRIVHAEHGRLPRVLLEVAHFDVPAQAQVAFVGPANSGKSRLLSTLSALERPERGSIWWGAVNVAAMEPAVAARWRRATVGIVGAAGLPLLGGLSTLQNVLLPARVPALRISRVVQEHARRLLDGVGIDARTPLARLPHADVRRVEIARALVCQSSRPATRHSHHVWTCDTTSRGSRCAG